VTADIGWSEAESKKGCEMGPTLPADPGDVNETGVFELADVAAEKIRAAGPPGVPIPRPPPVGNEHEGTKNERRRMIEESTTR